MLRGSKEESKRGKGREVGGGEKRVLQEKRMEYTSGRNEERSIEREEDSKEGEEDAGEGKIEEN